MTSSSKNGGQAVWLLVSFPSPTSAKMAAARERSFHPSIFFLSSIFHLSRAAAIFAETGLGTRLTFTVLYSIRNSALNSYDSGWDCTTIIISYTVQSPMFFYVLLYICTLTLLHVGALIELNYLAIIHDGRACAECGDVESLAQDRART